ncbi:hypothetical protein [Streptomyces ureilyticus]|uniref:Uncharacterized protein n=1 Tax=Streptomyces ureilyticus TaxID=1775131 RepID=A0ABX0DSV1_9ACTN|nr:hypothetical protein [Streptomyces ureilyticus]NGO43790.1 hypothetical protein [Streptomyces ureilyticus]
MKLTELPELTDEEILQQIADTLDHCQYGADPFTAVELDAIVRYTRDNQGIPDAVSGLDADGIYAYSKEFGQADAVGMVRAHFRMLSEWSEAYTVLKLDGLPRDDEGDFSPAAVRFLGLELVAVQNAGRALHSALAEHCLGKDENGYPYGSLAPAGGYRHVDGMFWVDPA